MVMFIGCQIEPQIRLGPESNRRKSGREGGKARCAKGKWMKREGEKKVARFRKNSDKRALGPKSNGSIDWYVRNKVGNVSYYGAAAEEAMQKGSLRWPCRHSVSSKGNVIHSRKTTGAPPVSWSQTFGLLDLGLVYTIITG